MDNQGVLDPAWVSLSKRNNSRERSGGRAVLLMYSSQVRRSGRAASYIIYIQRRLKEPGHDVGFLGFDLGFDLG